MGLTPNKIYRNYLLKNYHEGYAIELLKVLIEYSEDDFTRAECVRILKKYTRKNKTIFQLLERLVISDSSEIVRYSAAKALKERYFLESLKIFSWILYHDPSINCKIIVLKALVKINNNNTNLILIEQINQIKHNQFKESIKNIQTKDALSRYSCERLINILMNYYTITYLENKLNCIQYKLENGLVVELDIRNIYKLEDAWRYKNNITGVSNFDGFKYLKDIKMLKCLSLENSVKNQYGYYCEVSLLRILKRINNNVAKKFLLFHLNKIQNESFLSEYENLKILFNVKYMESLPNSILAEILINYLTFLFFIRRYNNLRYKVKNGFIVEFILVNSKLIKLPEFIANFKALKVLKLNFCSLYQIPESLGSLKFLKVLELKGNNLEVIPESMGNLYFLKLLNLSKNKIEKISFSFKRNSNLEVVDLAENNLTEIPKSIGNLKNLKYLDISKNKIINLPKTIINLQLLEYLNCSYNKLESLPENIGMLNFLKYFNLDNNNLLSLPESIKGFKNIRELRIAENKLLNLPKGIGYLHFLEKLDLSSNNLTSLPESIGLLKMLKDLNLTSNELKNLPDSIGLLSSLINLDLTWNDLTNLPNSIGNLISLESLILYDNKLNSLPESINNLKSLKYLNLYENNLSKLPLTRLENNICLKV